MQTSENVNSSQLASAYERYAEDLQRFCRSKMRSAEEAQDIVQETFLRTWEYLRAGNTIDEPKTFLYRVARNLIIDDFRKKKELSLTALQEQGFDPGHEPHEQMQQSMEVEHMLQAARHSEEYELLSLRYIAGLRTTDIARRKGIAPNTVAVRLHRALKRIVRKFIRKVKKNDVVTKI